MKSTVINIFRDKNTDTVHQVGEELELTKKRFDEINSTSFGVFVEELANDTKEGD